MSQAHLPRLITCREHDADLIFEEEMAQGRLQHRLKAAAGGAQRLPVEGAMCELPNRQKDLENMQMVSNRAFTMPKQICSQNMQSKVVRETE